MKYVLPVKKLEKATGLSNSQASVHLNRLVELEYVYAHCGRNGQRFVYELVFDGDAKSDAPQLIGLIDIEQLKNNATTKKLPAENDKLTHSFRPASGALPATLRATENSLKASSDSALSQEQGGISSISTYTAENNQGSGRHSLIAEA